MRSALGLGMVLVAACGGSGGGLPAKTAGEPPAEATNAAGPVMTKAAIKSPVACLKGDSSCGGGVCDLAVHNDCDKPLTCDVFITSACKTTNGFGEAKGRKRGTFPAKADDKLNLAAYCTEGDVVRTEVAEIKCQ